MAKKEFDTDKFVTRLRELRKKGATFDEIAATLTTEGFKTPNGKKLHTKWLYANARKYTKGGAKRTTTKTRTASAYTGRVAQKTRNVIESAERATAVARYVTAIINDNELNAETRIDLVQRLTA